MFKSEARLFINANNNVNLAKTLINECKRLVSDFSLEGNSDSQNFKSNINNCNIDALVTKIENTKESLMKLDQTFADEYMTLLQEHLQTTSIDTSNMTDEERMQYNIQMNNYYRDYNFNLFYMLDRLQKNGQLTPEIEKMIEQEYGTNYNYQKAIVEQYDVQDKMAVLDPTSEEYINLFKENAEHDRQLIKLNPNLTEEQKASYLEEYETQYNQNLEALQNARNERLKREADEKELKELYQAKEDNNGFFRYDIECEIDEAILDKKIEMGIASEDEIAYKNMNGWDRFWTDTGTFAVSAYVGLYDVTETIGDGLAMVGGFVGICDKEWVSECVSADMSSELYEGIRISTGMNDYSAYGNWHTAGNFVGNTVGYAGMSFAAPWASALLGGFSAMGSSSERALNSGASFYEAFGTGAISFGAGAVSGWAVGKLGALAQGSTSLMQVGGYTLAGMGVSTLEPIVNSFAEYNIYADEMVDQNGNKVYDNIWDYYVDAGGLSNTIMAGVSSGISVGGRAFKSYSTRQKLRNEQIKTLTGKISDSQSELDNLINQRNTLTDVDSIKACDAEIKSVKNNIKNLQSRMDELINLESISKETKVRLDGVYGKDALEKHEIYDILLTEKGKRAELGYLAVDGDLNKIQVEKFRNKNNYSFFAENNLGEISEIKVNVNDYSGIKFVNASAADKGLVGGFVANLDETIEYAKNLKLKNPNISEAEFISALEKYIDCEPGYLSKCKAVIFSFDETDIRIPNGDEYGAWANYWKPGGLTTSGALEVQTTIDVNGLISDTNKYSTMTMSEFFSSI